MANVMMVASEAVPFVKSAGLADVVTSLSAALRSLGHHVIVMLPRYASVELERARLVLEHMPVYLGDTRYNTSIYVIDAEVPFYFVDCPDLFGRRGIYGDRDRDYADNHIRFAVLSKAALEACRFIFRPDVIHCHDWQAGLVPVFLRTVLNNDPTFVGIRTLFTIHNLGYQGLFPRDCLKDIGLSDNVFSIDGIEFFGQISFIKGGLNYADALNTISPTYAREIQTPEYGLGLDGLLRARSNALTGILNGVDYSEWGPENDPLIPAHYSKEDLSGKRVCKDRLLNESGLSPLAMNRPLIGIIARFTRQKGTDIFVEALDQIVAADMYIVALGSGEPEYEEFFRRLAEIYPDRISVRIGFDNALAHRIEAGADIFLMPSRYEPCGLNQIYSLRYGTVPVARATGGLNDTIDSETGFKFVDYSGAALFDAVAAADRVFRDRPRWEQMMQRGMEKDFSWQSSARVYAAIYEGLVRGSR